MPFIGVISLVFCLGAAPEVVTARCGADGMATPRRGGTWPSVWSGFECFFMCFSLKLVARVLLDHELVLERFLRQAVRVVDAVHHRVVLECDELVEASGQDLDPGRRH